LRRTIYLKIERGGSAAAGIGIFDSHGICAGGGGVAGGGQLRGGDERGGERGIV